MKRVLTDEQVNEASQLYEDGKSTYKIADIFNVSRMTISRNIKNNGTKIRSQSEAQRLLTDEQVNEASRLYENGKTLEEVANIFDVSCTAISNGFKRNGTKTRSLAEANRVYILNENIFNNINENSAYWIGFLLADGNIYELGNGQNEISIGLSKKDTKHLYKFRKFLKTDRPVREYDKSSKISFNSNKVSKELSKYGVIPRKSLIAEAKGNIKNNKHFWRGCIDGDGGIHLNKKDQINIYLYGTKKICSQFRTYVQKFSSTQANIRQHGSIYKFEVKGNIQVPKLLNHFYKDASIYLDRKFELAKKYF